ncbi:MAG TPA: hypothetical protein VNK95_05955, partial [Caldilineaceae bacterium]|nr:hypothetical protein [Caldilineaceae bacterium]
MSSLAQPMSLSPVQRLLRGPTGLLLVVAYIAGATYMVTQEPRSLLWRLLFLAGLLFVYYMPQRI